MPLFNVLRVASLICLPRIAIVGVLFFADAPRAAHCRLLPTDLVACLCAIIYLLHCLSFLRFLLAGGPTPPRTAGSAGA